MRLMSPALGFALAVLNGIALGAPAAPSGAPVNSAPFNSAPLNGAPVNGAAANNAPVNAVWRERHVAFAYRGRTARYSCDGLREKVRAMLLDLGARRDLKVVALGCGAERVGLEAHFEVFTLARDTFRNLGIGDCELVEEFARQVLPKLTTREVRQDITCVPNQLSGNRFRVHGEVLKAEPIPAP
jgi:hypothetical protein